MIMRISTVSPPGLQVMAQGAAVFLSAHFANGCPGTGVAAVMGFGAAESLVPQTDEPIIIVKLEKEENGE